MTIIEIGDGRGLSRVELAKKNKELIKKFFKENPNATQKACAEETGLSDTTIRKHLRALGYK